MEELLPEMERGKEPFWRVQWWERKGWKSAVINAADIEVQGKRKQERARRKRYSFRKLFTHFKPVTILHQDGTLRNDDPNGVRCLDISKSF